MTSWRCYFAWIPAAKILGSCVSKHELNPSITSASGNIFEILNFELTWELCFLRKVFPWPEWELPRWQKPLRRRRLRCNIWKDKNDLCNRCSRLGFGFYLDQSSFEVTFPLASSPSFPLSYPLNNQHSLFGEKSTFFHHVHKRLM